VRLHWKILKFAIIPVFAVMGTGCSGINASRSVSPASFLLPGLMQTSPQPSQPEITVPQLERVKQVAQAQ
jgi:hypothetical protein